MQPGPNDGYTWSVAKGYERLIAGNLSSGSVGVYNDIIENLGQSLEAVDPTSLAEVCATEDAEPRVHVSWCNIICGTSLDVGLTRQDPGSRIGDASFTATIQRLERENERLAEEASQARASAESLQAKVHEWEIRWRTAQEQLAGDQRKVARLGQELRRIQGSMADAVSILQSHRPDGDAPHPATEKPHGPDAIPSQRHEDASATPDELGVVAAVSETKTRVSLPDSRPTLHIEPE